MNVDAHASLALILCGDEGEAERLCQRGFDAVHFVDERERHAERFRHRWVLVTPAGAARRPDVAAMLFASGCDVRLLSLMFNPDCDDPTTHVTGNFYEPPIDPSVWPEPLDLKALAARVPEPPRFIVRDWLPVGYATLLAGHGGVGKSAIGLHLAVCIALGLPFFGIETEQRRVLYLSCEDRENVLHWRLAHICAHLGIGLADLRGQLAVRDLVGRDVVLWERDPRTGFTVTMAYERLASIIEREDSQLPIIDGVSDTFGGNENARSDVKRFVNTLLALIPRDGALLLLAHVARPAASGMSTSEGYSGSTQWHNAVRARWYLYPETERDEDARTQRTGTLLLELQKSNLGGIVPTVTFRWDEAARLFVATGTVGSGGIVDAIRERTERQAILKALIASTEAGVPVPAATQGQRTGYLVLSQRPEFPDALRGGARLKTKRFWRHIEALRQIRHVTESSIRRANRHPLLILKVTSEGRVEYANT